MRVLSRAWRLASLFLGLTLVAEFGYAQSDPGRIVGKVIDAETGDPIGSADVAMEDDSVATVSDLNGNFVLNGVADGSRSMKATKQGYRPATIRDVVVLPGATATITIPMEKGVAAAPGSDSGLLVLDAIEVNATLVQGSELALISDRQKAFSISDAIGSDTFSRLGFGDAAAAMQSVTGATVQGDKYVFIRGLGDRYSSTLLDGAEVPSSDPDRRAVQMDLFSTDFVESIVTSKTFTPDRPGNFTGGAVDIKTKSIPDSFSFKISLSAGFNTETLGEDFLTYEGGGDNWLARDDGTRALPALADVDFPPISNANNPQIGAITRSFRQVMAPTTDEGSFDRGFSLTYGNRHEFGESMVLGTVLNLSYDRSFSNYADGRSGRFRNESFDSNALSTLVSLSDAKSTDEAQIGTLAKVGFQFNPENQVSLTYLGTQSGEDVTRQQVGLITIGGGVNESEVVTIRTLRYVERTLNSLSLEGDHVIPAWNETRLAWAISRSDSNQDEPDFRTFPTSFNTETGTYTAGSRAGLVADRLFRNLGEERMDVRLDVTYPFEFNGESASLKAGFLLSTTDRNYKERTYRYTYEGYDFDGDDQTFFNDEIAGRVDSTGRFITPTYFLLGLGARDFPDYEGSQEINGYYLMAEIPLGPRLRLIGGARAETTDISVTFANPVPRTRQDGSLSEDDILPALSAVYEIVDDMNLRAAYGRTLARPNFREFAQTVEYSGFADYIFIGNPDLKRTLVDNFDVRWEWFLGKGDLLAASLFWKEMTNPIEFGIFSPINNAEIQPQNSDSGRVYGIELEARRGLGWFTEALDAFSVGANLTLADSQVTIPEAQLELARLFDPTASSTRPLVGQSSYVVNLDLSYENRSGTTASLYFNLFGERLVLVAEPGTPDVYEQPAPTLDFVFSQRLWRFWKFSFSAKNLLQSEYEESQEFRGETYIKQTHERGMDFSFGVTRSF